MNLRLEIWAAWLGATAVAAVSSTFILLTFAYGQFETKEHAKERFELVQDELKMINGKLDRILSYELATSNRSPSKQKDR